MRKPKTQLLTIQKEAVATDYLLGLSLMKMGEKYRVSEKTIRDFISSPVMQETIPEVWDAMGRAFLAGEALK